MDYFAASGDESASLDELAGFVIAREDESSEETREDIRLRLHHTTLPKLDDLGLVDYDLRTTTARYYGYSNLEHLQEIIGEIERLDRCNG